MESVSTKIKNLSTNILIISSRKVDFLSALVSNLVNNHQKLPSPEIIPKLIEIVSSLDPLLFVSDKERQEGHLSLNTPIEDVNLQGIKELLPTRIGNFMVVG